MFNRRTYLTGWAAASAAVLIASLTFPHIAAEATENRDHVVWEAMAADYLTAERTGQLDLAPMVETLTVPVDANYPEKLADARFTADERHCLAEAVYYEARSETRSGQKAVAEVVLNRVDSKHFPNTICGVVYEGSGRTTGCQFSFTCDGSLDIAPKGKSWERSQDIATLVMTGGVKPFTGKATHYHTTAVKPKWSKNLRMTKRVDSHVFYKFAPRDYTPSMPTMVTVAPPS